VEDPWNLGVPLMELHSGSHFVTVKQEHSHPQ